MQNFKIKITIQDLEDNDLVSGSFTNEESELLKATTLISLPEMTISKLLEILEKQKQEKPL